tara:strand:+ start:331 stop:1032 length:702 start_codon:yes stop_codon:yes gene_type:complete
MNTSVGISVLKGAYKWVHDKVGKDNSPPNQVLEPFSTLLKLAIISYKPDGVKIAISNNKLYIQETGLSQPILRYAYGNNREEIHHLLKPLMRCIDLYPLDENDELNLIYKQAIEGLKKLKISYNNELSTVCFTIDLYIQILQQTLSEKSVYVHSYDNSQSLSGLSLSTNTRLNLEKIFEGIWNKNDISLVSSMFISVSTAIDCRDSYLKGIENIIKAKESLIEAKINRATQLV